MWWIKDLEPQEVSFLAILAGFFTLVAGSIFNSHLSRRRDDRIRSEEAKSLAAALIAEMKLIRDSLEHNANGLENNADGTSDAFFPNFDAISVVLKAAIPKVGLLNEDAISKILLAYGTLPTLFDSLGLALGRIEERNGRIYAIIEPANHRWASKQVRHLVPMFDQAILALQRR